jgi:penicillin-binding protein 2
MRTGIDPLGEIGHAVGFGMKSGIELAEENSGIMPTPEWKQRALNQPWWKGETISVAIGQGMLQITPLQAANLMATVSTGVRYRPHLVREVHAPDGGLVRKVEPEEVGRLKLKQEHQEMVRDALHGVVEEGTGRKAKNPAFPVAGKTGTAQVVTRRLGLGNNVPERYRDHNWFACYVSGDDGPALAMTVFIENGGKQGSLAKAAIAGQIIAAYMPLIYPERAARFAALEAESKKPAGTPRQPGARAAPTRQPPAAAAPAAADEPDDEEGVVDDPEGAVHD